METVQDRTGGTGAAGEASASTAQLSGELQAALVRELQRAWHTVNASYFRSVLLPPTLGLHAGAQRLGLWQRGSRTLTLSQQLVQQQPWGVVLEVLKHEMAHQYVHEILGRTAEVDETAHGPAFQAVCERLGIDGTASGLPTLENPLEDGAEPGSQPAGERMRLLRRIGRLLALAQSQNVHEAEAAMHEAQRLMLKHNLEGVAARGQQAARFGFRHLGAVKGRIDEAQRLLAMLLGRHFFVEVIWVPSYDVAAGRRGTVLEICGSSENLEMAAYVYDFLTHTAERLWQQHKQQEGIVGDRERRTYLAGVMLGFAERLAEKERVQQKEGLVWTGDPLLGRFFRRRHPHVRRVYQKGQPRTEARSEGKKAGRQIVLHRPISDSGGSRGSGGATRLLPARR